MPSNVIPRPSEMYDHATAADVDMRLAEARNAELADDEDCAAGYTPTSGLAARVEELEAEYLRTYGEPAPKSHGLLLIRRRAHLLAARAS